MRVRKMSITTIVEIIVALGLAIWFWRTFYIVGTKIFRSTLSPEELYRFSFAVLAICLSFVDKARLVIGSLSLVFLLALLAIDQQYGTAHLSVLIVGWKFQTSLYLGICLFLPPSILAYAARKMVQPETERVEERRVVEKPIPLDGLERE